MTVNKSLKRLIRARMKQTGESYSTARRFLLHSEENTMSNNAKSTSIRLESASLVLRLFEENDTDFGLFLDGIAGMKKDGNRLDMYQKLAEPEVDKKNFFQYLVSDVDTTWKGASGFKLQVFNRDESQWLGSIIFYNMKENVASADMDPVLLNQHDTQEIRTEAVKTALTYAWKAGLHRIESTPETSDVRSIDFFEELGMRFEGIRRHGGFIDGSWRDLSIYATTVGEVV